MRHRHTRAAVTTGKGEGGADVTKSAAFRNGTRACTTMGISTAGEVGHYTESADFRNGTRRYAKTLRFCHIWPSVASVRYGAGERYETRGIPQRYIRETVQILRRFRTTTAFQLKTKLKLKTDYFAWLSRFSPIRGSR